MISEFAAAAPDTQTDRHGRLYELAVTSGKFLSVGALSTLIEIVLFNAFVWLGWSLVWAKVGAVTLSTVNAYFGNRLWAFKGARRRAPANEAISFLLVNGACLGLGVLLLWVGVHAVSLILGRSAGPFAVNIVNLASIGFTTVVRFALYRWWVFGAKVSG
ncbi:GtrA family protein [Pseudoclavibacter soli]|uniref:GtrA family protein n=1 Tax=Pseudoclavibacter soli TaxID=452623 RepID=UPI000683DA65|nr:GtrA family protein [Pseudoclavibacter soli]